MTGEPPDDNPWLIDFFEEVETRENPPREEPEPAPQPVGPVRRPPKLAHAARLRLRRLGLLVAATLVITIVLALSLSGGSEAAADSSYAALIAVPAQSSQSVGTSLGQLLSTAPSSGSALESSLSQLLAKQQQDLAETIAITPPPRLRAAQAQAVSAMQFRVNGLAGLLSGFRDVIAHKTSANWAEELSIEAERLVTSDVIWQDLFVAPAEAQMRADGVASPTVPSSVFVADTNLTAPSAMKKILDDLSAPSSSSQTSGASAVLQLGDRGPAVSAWQQQLNQWIAKQSASGLTPLTVTGVFDQPTQTATMAFQTAEQLSVDGVVGPETRAALQSALGEPVSSTTSSTSSGAATGAASASTAGATTGTTSATTPVTTATGTTSG